MTPQFREMDNREELQRKLCEIAVQLEMAKTLICHGLPTGKDGSPLYAAARLRKAMVRIDDADSICSRLAFHVSVEYRCSLPHILD